MSETYLTDAMIQEGLRALDEVKHCEDKMTLTMLRIDKAMRDTPPNEWTPADVEAVKRTARHVNGPAEPTTGWQPIETAPKDGTFVLLASPSGYVSTPLRVEVCRYLPKYRPRQPWVNHALDSFTDGGELPTHWMPLPEAP